MLHLLQSNQPASWGIIPVLVALLVAVGAFGSGVLPLEWPPILGGLGVIAVSRVIHLMHIESGMRSKPTGIPSWAWAISAAPLVYVTPAELWWGSVLVLCALRLSLTLREGDVSGSPFFWMGIALALAPFLSESLFLWALVLPIVALSLRPFRPSETLAFLLGAVAPLGLYEAHTWWMEGAVHWPWAIEPLNSRVQWPAFGLLPMAVVGWLTRQKSLSRATARQRYARQVTQWTGLFLLGLATIGMGIQIPGVGEDTLYSAFAFFCAWTLGWVWPKGWKGARVVPWFMVAMATGAAYFLGTTAT